MPDLATRLSARDPVHASQKKRYPGRRWSACMKLLAILAVLGFALLAGCVGDDATVPSGAMQTEPQVHVAYLHPDGTLTGRQPEPASQRLAWSYQDWLLGSTPPNWDGVPGDHAVRVTQATITVQYRAVQPVVSSNLRPEFTAWFGTFDAEGRSAIVDHLFADGPDVLLPGETHTITFEVGLPLGGLVRATGEAFVLQVATYYPDSGDGTMEVLFGESRLEWWAIPVPDVTPALVEESTLRGSLLGGRCVADANAAGTASALHEIVVPANAVQLTLHLERVGGQGAGPDLDMALRNPDGDLVAYAGGSASPEAIRLYPANLEAAGPGPLQLMVYNCQPQASEYTVAVRLGLDG
jgi:hypothetical protein